MYRQKTEVECFRDRSIYPEEETMKPRHLHIGKFAVAPIMREFQGLLEPDIPLTAEEKARPFGSPKTGTALSSMNLDGFSSIWKQVGIHWVRQEEGPHPHCHTADREGAYVLWRDADNHYCYHGRPVRMDFASMQPTMEVWKPVLDIHVNDLPVVHIAMARSIAGPTDICWGTSTLEQWFEIKVDDSPKYHRWMNAGKTPTSVAKALHSIRRDIT